MAQLLMIAASLELIAGVPIMLTTALLSLPS
jgi:hypothetical protein